MTDRSETSFVRNVYRKGRRVCDKKRGYYFFTNMQIFQFFRSFSLISTSWADPFTMTLTVERKMSIDFSSEI